MKKKLNLDKVKIAAICFGIIIITSLALTFIIVNGIDYFKNNKKVEITEETENQTCEMESTYQDNIITGEEIKNLLIWNVEYDKSIEAIIIFSIQELPVPIWNHFANNGGLIYVVEYGSATVSNEIVSAGLTIASATYYRDFNNSPVIEISNKYCYDGTILHEFGHYFYDNELGAVDNFTSNMTEHYVKENPYFIAKRVNGSNYYTFIKEYYAEVFSQLIRNDYEPIEECPKSCEDILELMYEL